jgi:glycerol-3-phosphate acyltransferase PlsY
MIIAKFVAVIVLGYLLGSISFGMIISRWAGKEDVRDYGSGKTGTTNVLRTAGKKAAVIVLVLDVMKGVLAVVFAGLIIGEGYLVLGGSVFGVVDGQCLAAMAAVIGHIWPVFLKFRGGRGVATYMGGLVALCPPAAIFGAEVFLISAGLSGYASLGSIAGIVGAYVILVPLTVLNGLPVEYLIYSLVGGALIIVMHRDNIIRLINGTERRFSLKAEKRN